jgi:hypothetical protein
MFISALFTIAKLWKQPRCPTNSEWIKKMEFYSAIRKNEILSLTSEWMELEDILNNVRLRRQNIRVWEVKG